MILTNCYCDLCKQLIMTPNDGNTVGFGATNNVRTPAPPEQTTSAGIQVCGECCKLIAGVWQLRRKPAEPPTA